jgi:hypothetical protein
VAVVGDTSEVSSVQFDINSISIPAGRGARATAEWDRFAQELTLAIAAAASGRTLPIEASSIDAEKAPDAAATGTTDLISDAPTVPSSIWDRPSYSDDPMPTSTVAPNGRSAEKAARKAAAARQRGEETAERKQTKAAVRAASASAKVADRSERERVAAGRRQAKEIETANKGFAERHHAWLENQRAVQEFLDDARDFRGQGTNAIILKKDELEYFTVSGNLIEERAGKATYTGSRQGISVPIGQIGGHSIRYNVGRSKGHVERAAPVDTIIDTGTVVVTDQRIVFVGSKQTREHLFTKLMSVDYPTHGEVVISVSNRQKSTHLTYSSNLSGQFQTRASLALSVFRGQVDEYIQEMEGAIGSITAAEPKLRT